MRGLQLKKIDKTFVLWCVCICIYALASIFVFSNIKNQMPTRYVAEKKEYTNITEATGDYHIILNKEYDEIIIPVLAVGQGQSKLNISIQGDSGEIHRNIVLDATDEENLELEDLRLLFTDAVIIGYAGHELTITLDNEYTSGTKVYVITDVDNDAQIEFESVCNTKIAIYIYWIVTLVGFSSGCIFIVRKKIKKLELYNAYAFLAVPLSIIFIVLIPGNCSNDSTTHVFFVSEEINTITGHSDRNLGNYTVLPAREMDVIYNVLYDCNQSFAQPNVKMYDENYRYLINNISSDEELVQSGWKQSSTPNLIEYLPYIPFFFLGRVFKWNFLITILLSRISCAALYIICIRLAIKLAPYGKLALCFYGLSPMLMQEATTIGYDTFVNLGMIMGIVTLAKICNLDFEVTLSDKILIVICVVFIASAKSGIYAVVYCAMLLCSTLFHRKGREYLIQNIPFVITVGVALAVSVIAFNFRLLAGSSSALTEESVAALMLREKPGAWFLNIFRNVFNDLGRLFFEALGVNLGWNEKVLSNWNLSLIIVFFIIALTQDEKTNKTRNVGAFFVSLFAFTIIIYHLLWVADYSGTSHIIGVQGRYFIPWIIALIMFLKPQKIKSFFDNDKLIPGYYLVMLSNVLVLLSKYTTR